MGYLGQGLADRVGPRKGAGMPAVLDCGGELEGQGVLRLAGWVHCITRIGPEWPCESCEGVAGAWCGYGCDDQGMCACGMGDVIELGRCGDVYGIYTELVGPWCS